MIYADALVGTTNGQTNTALFAESIEVCEVVLEGASSTLVTVLIYHSVGGRNFRKIGTYTIQPANPSVDMHLNPLWPPGQYYASISGLVGSDKIYVSFAGE